MDDFPQELVDRFIDFCDVKEIMTCSLVCKAWVIRSRYQLFARVPLTLRAQSLSRVVDIVNTSSFPILSHIRGLLLFIAPDALDENLLAQLHPCPNLRSIRIVGVDDQLEINVADQSIVDSPISQQLDAVQPHLRAWAVDAPSITKLELGLFARTVIPLQTVMGVVSCLPGLTTLRLKGVGTKEPSPSPSPHLASLRTLSVPGCDGVLFSWLLTLPTVPALHHLTIGAVHSRRVQLQPLARYIQTAGHALKSFDLDTSWDVTLVYTRTILKHISPNLRHFTCRFYFLKQIPEILILLPTTSKLRPITFIPFCSDLIDKEADYLDAFHSALVDHRFPAAHHWGKEYDYRGGNESIATSKCTWYFARR
ncbi:hypothetical protein FB45DRAFT_1065933 [Roridomyces roridus]|uniref:F-box domain-containing protein n=1 Tax=Roridomyces roridus TaxID=1738132 RepID=A0AAD7B5G4_9AGAR|nr:hypothetical protein FB45DRAFT_1065933 [Roridomyces roridus]